MTDKTDSKEREAFKAAHRHLELDEVPDAWGRPVFKHSHVEASWLGWKARASLAGSAGSEPVAWVDERALNWLANSRSLSATITTKLEKGKSFERPTPLYLHPSPPEVMVGGWTKASQQLPPCRDDQLYIGINTAGFAGVFNDVADVAGNVLCFYETAEEYIKVMSNLDIWQPFTPPTPTSSADSRKGE